MTRKKSPNSPLPAVELANCYFQLYRLEVAGLPRTEAMSLLVKAGGETGKRARIALNLLKRGKPLSEAGKRAGLFVGLDAALVQVAEEGGTYAAVFEQLAQYHDEKARQIRQIKSRLLLPLTVLVLALFIHPVPALFGGQITFLEYLGATLGVIVQLALLVFVLIKLPHWLRHGFLKPLGMKYFLDQMQIKVPYFGHWYVRRSLRDFLRALGLMLQAGLPILEALPKALEVLVNVSLRQRFQTIISALQRGDSFAEALSDVEGVNSMAVQLLSTGESAGSLAEMMLHYVKIESEEITRHHEKLAAWIPRGIYALIAAGMIYSIFSAGASFMSSMPEGV